MVADLDRRHRLVGVPARGVEALLGPGECYVSYEDEPCYGVELGGERYALQFGVNHSDAPGRVVFARLRKYPPLRSAPRRLTMRGSRPAAGSVVVDCRPAPPHNRDRHARRHGAGG